MIQVFVSQYVLIVPNYLIQDILHLIQSGRIKYIYTMVLSILHRRANFNRKIGEAKVAF